MCVLSLVLEILIPNDVRPMLLRCSSTLVQGAWFWAVGFILYPPSGWSKWKEDDHHQGMIVTMMFTWHIAGVILFQMGMACLIYKSVKRRLEREGMNMGACSDRDYEEVEAGAGYTRLPLSDQTKNLLNDDE